MSEKGKAKDKLMMASNQVRFSNFNGPQFGQLSKLFAVSWIPHLLQRIISPNLCSHEVCYHNWNAMCWTDVPVFFRRSNGSARLIWTTPSCFCNSFVVCSDEFGKIQCDRVSRFMGIVSSGIEFRSNPLNQRLQIQIFRRIQETEFRRWKLFWAYWLLYAACSRRSQFKLRWSKR